MILGEFDRISRMISMTIARRTEPKKAIAPCDLVHNIVDKQELEKLKKIGIKVFLPDRCLRRAIELHWLQKDW
jgi:hypothetical protein